MKPAAVILAALLAGCASMPAHCLRTPLSVRLVDGFDAGDGQDLGAVSSPRQPNRDTSR